MPFSSQQIRGKTCLACTHLHTLGSIWMLQLLKFWLDHFVICGFGQHSLPNGRLYWQLHIKLHCYQIVIKDPAKHTQHFNVTYTALQNYCVQHIAHVWPPAFNVFQDVGWCNRMAKHVKHTLYMYCAYEPCKWPSSPRVSPWEMGFETRFISLQVPPFRHAEYFHLSQHCNNVALKCCVCLVRPVIKYLHVCEPLEGQCNWVIHNGTSQSYKMRRTPWPSCFYSS